MLARLQRPTRKLIPRGLGVATTVIRESPSSMRQSLLFNSRIRQLKRANSSFLLPSNFLSIFQELSSI